MTVTIPLTLTLDEAQMIRASLDLSADHAKKAAKQLHGVSRHEEYACEEVCKYYRNLDQKIMNAIYSEYYKQTGLKPDEA